MQQQQQLPKYMCNFVKSIAKDFSIEKEGRAGVVKRQCRNISRKEDSIGKILHIVASVV